MLTRAEFDTACKSFIEHGWSWNEHPSVPGLGFLSRTVHHFRRLQSLSTDIDVDLPLIAQDEAEAMTPPENLISRQYVVYSPTFQVPAFYFTLHDSMGSPLPLADLVCTTLFHRFAFEHTESSTFGLTHPGSSFPILSQGDHPTLGTPCWYLHPCATAQAVGELMAGAEAEDCTQVVPLRRWLDFWFIVLGTAVNTRS